MSLKQQNANKPTVNRNHSEPQFTPQPKLKSGGSADIQEKEADQVADQVVQPKLNQGGEPAFFQPNPILQRQIQLKRETDVQKLEEPESDLLQSKESTPKIQAMGSGTSGDDDEIQKKDDGETDDVQMKSETPQVQAMGVGTDDDEVQKSQNGEGGNGVGSIESDLNASKGGGSPMDGEVKNEMESGIGNDFSNVRIHTDAKAQEMSDKIGAQAFTNGNDIYFNQGKYNPSSKDGKHLLAHELTHTVQQGASGEKVQKKDLFEKRELTPEEQEIKTEFDEYVKLVKKHLYPTYTDKEQKKFENNVKKFERKMANGLTKYSEKLKIGTWGSDDYWRLRDKFFLNYKDVIKDEIDRLTADIKVTIGDLTDSLFDSITTTESFIKIAGSDQAKAEELMNHSAEKIEEAVQKRDKAVKTLKEYGTDENSAPILAEFDKIIARYQALNKMFAKAFGGIGVDLGEFVKILPELDRNQSLLDNFNSKFASATKLSEFQDLKKNEIPKLMDEIDILFNMVYDLERKTDGVDEIAYEEEKDQMDQTITDQEGKVDQIKADELERRRLAELKRKRKEEEERKKKEKEWKNSDVPSIFVTDNTVRIASTESDAAKDDVDVVATRGGKDYTTSNWSPYQSVKDQKKKIDPSKLSKSDKAFFAQYKLTCDNYLKEYYKTKKNTAHKLTGEMFVTAAKKVYLKYGHLSYVIPPELALLQARIETSLNTSGAKGYNNPFNVGERDSGAMPWVKLMTSPEIGIYFYMDLLAHDYLSDKTPDELLDNYVNDHGIRYATSPHYEMEHKGGMGQIGLVADGKRPKVSVGKGYKKNDNTESGRFVRGMLNELGYKQPDLGDAIMAFQDEVMFPELTADEKERVKNMNQGDRDNFYIKENNWVDGVASPRAYTVGLLYYMTEMKKGGGTTVVHGTTQVKELVKQYEAGELTIDELGKSLIPFCKYFGNDVIEVIDDFGWLYEDDISQVITRPASTLELSHFDPALLERMKKALDPANNIISAEDEKLEWNRVRTALGENISSTETTISDNTNTTAGGNYIVTNGEAWVRDEKGQPLNTSGQVHKKGEKHKIIPKGTQVVVTKKKDGLVKVTSADGKTVYGWTNKTNLTKVVNPSEISAWKKKTVDASLPVGEKNKKYAELILEAEEIGLVVISDEGKKFTESGLGGVQETFVKIKNQEKIGSGKHKGVEKDYKFDPKNEEIKILQVIVHILRKEVERWEKNGRKGKVTDLKIGSFMIWNNRGTKTGELRDPSHGAGRAIDINIVDMNWNTKDAVDVVIRTIKQLPKLKGYKYGFGLPYQGDFFSSSGKIKSKKLLKAFSEMKADGYTIYWFPDANNHLHIQMVAMNQ